MKNKIVLRQELVKWTDLVKQTGKLIEEKDGYSWYSICSAHQKVDQNCPRCRVGSWHKIADEK